MADKQHEHNSKLQLCNVGVNDRQDYLDQRQQVRETQRFLLERFHFIFFQNKFTLRKASNFLNYS